MTILNTHTKHHQCSSNCLPYDHFSISFLIYQQRLSLSYGVARGSNIQHMAKWIWGYTAEAGGIVASIPPGCLAEVCLAYFCSNINTARPGVAERLQHTARPAHFVHMIAIAISSDLLTGRTDPLACIVRNKRFGSEHDRLWESGSCESLLQRMAACGYTMRDGLMQQL